MPCFGSENNAVVCPVVLLDETEMTVEIKANMKGQELLDEVFGRINLRERDYFGLRFMDHCEEARWLDPQKSVMKQNRNTSVFYFGVRFYSSDPCKLQEELTRYLFFEQLKRDILQSRLHCSFTVATRLFAYVVQAELGDYDPRRHTMGYVSEFRLLPNQDSIINESENDVIRVLRLIGRLIKIYWKFTANCGLTFASEELEAQTEEIHKTLKDMVPADCELEFLDKAKWLELYGADMHHVRGEDGVDYEFGIKPSGLLVKKRGNIVGNYVWPKISKLYFKAKTFHLSVWGKNEKEDNYTFVLPRKSSCKHLWKNCVEHHAFFRLEKSNTNVPELQRFFHFGSKHRYSGRTQREALQDSMKRKRQAPEVKRKASKKYPRRSFQEKRKATPGSQPRKSYGGVNTSAHSSHSTNGQNRWSHPHGEGNTNGATGHKHGGLYTSGDNIANQGSHLAKFPKPGRRPGGLSGSDTESSRRRRGGRSYVSDDEADVRRRRHRHRRRRNNRGYASAGDASGTETEGTNYIERQRNTRAHYSETEGPYDSTAQWVDSTQNVHQVARERQGRSYEDVRSRQKQIVYKSVPDVSLSPALVPVQKSSVSIARVREDRSHVNPHRYSGTHMSQDSLYKVRSESANNKLNFKVLLELGPETGMPMDSPPKANASAAGKIPQKTTPHGYERPRSYQNHRLSGGQHPNRPANFVESSTQKRRPMPSSHTPLRSPQRSPANHQFMGIKSTQL